MLGIKKGYTFKLSDEEYKKLKLWFDEITKDMKKIGGYPYFVFFFAGITLNITPSSLGELVTAECTIRHTITLREPNI
jgi:hypothetical protein